VADVAQVIINSAKIENDYIKIIGGSHGTGFIEEGRNEVKQLNEKV
jgi:hypothetical protein